MCRSLKESTRVLQFAMVKELICGRMKYDNEMLAPLPARGSLNVQRTKDGSVQLKWVPANSAGVPDSTEESSFPVSYKVSKETEMSRIDAAPSGRVYVVKNLTSVCSGPNSPSVVRPTESGAGMPHSALGATSGSCVLFVYSLEKSVNADTSFIHELQAAAKSISSGSSTNSQHDEDMESGSRSEAHSSDGLDDVELPPDVANYLQQLANDLNGQSPTSGDHGFDHDDHHDHDHHGHHDHDDNSEDDEEYGSEQGEEYSAQFVFALVSEYVRLACQVVAFQAAQSSAAASSSAAAVSRDSAQESATNQINASQPPSGSAPSGKSTAPSTSGAVPSALPRMHEGLPLVSRHPHMDSPVKKQARLMTDVSEPKVSIGQILSRTTIKDLLSDPAVKEKISSLIPAVDTDALESLTSPQAGETMRRFTQALSGGNASVLFAALGVDPSVLQEFDDPVEALCRGLERKFETEPSQQ